MVMKTHTCRWCDHKWEHEHGQFCPSCHRFQTTPTTHTSQPSTDAIMNAINEEKKITYIAEVFLFVPWRGQARFRMFVNGDTIMFGPSKRDYDSTIETMSGHRVARISTTHELKDFMTDNLELKSHIRIGLRDMVKNIENPHQYLNQMYKLCFLAGDENVEAYIFPLYK